MALGPDPESVKVLGPDPDSIKTLGPDPESVRELPDPSEAIVDSPEPQEERRIQWIHPGHTFQYSDGRMAEAVEPHLTLAAKEGGFREIPKMHWIDVGLREGPVGLLGRISEKDPELEEWIKVNRMNQSLLEGVGSEVVSFISGGPIPSLGGKVVAAPVKSLSSRLSKIGVEKGVANTIARKAGDIATSVAHGAGTLGTYGLMTEPQRSILETGEIDPSRVAAGVAGMGKAGAVLGLGGGIGSAILTRAPALGGFAGGTAAIAKMNASEHGRRWPNKEDWVEATALNVAFFIGRGMERATTGIVKKGVEVLRGDPKIRELAARVEELNNSIEARKRNIAAKEKQLESVTDEVGRRKVEGDIEAYRNEIDELIGRINTKAAESVQDVKPVGLAQIGEERKRREEVEDPRLPKGVDEISQLFREPQTVPGGVFDRFRKAEVGRIVLNASDLDKQLNMLQSEIHGVAPKITGDLDSYIHSLRTGWMQGGLDSLHKNLGLLAERITEHRDAGNINETEYGRVKGLYHDAQTRILALVSNARARMPQDGGTLIWSPGEVAYHGAKANRLAHLDSLEPIARGREAPKAEVGEGGGAGLFISDVPGFAKHFGQWIYAVEPLRDLKLLVRLNTDIEQRQGFWGPSSYQTWKREWIRSLGVKGWEKVAGRSLFGGGREVFKKWFEQGAPDMTESYKVYGYAREIWESLSERTKNYIAGWGQRNYGSPGLHPIAMLGDYIKYKQGRMWSDNSKRAWAIHQRQRAIKEGYDGVIETDVQEKPEVIIFKRNAIKSLSRRPVNWVAGRDVTQGREEEWYDPEWQGEAGRIEKEVTEALTKAGALKPAEAREWERVKLFVKDLAPGPGEANLDSLIAEVESKYAGVPDRVKVGHLLATIANKVNNAEASPATDWVYPEAQRRYVQYLRNVTAAIDDVAGDARQDAEALESTAITELLMVASGGNNKYLQGLDVRYGGEPRVATPEERAATTLSPDQGLEVMGYWSVDPVRLRRTIEVFKGADLGTALHEFAHDVTQSLMTPRDRAIIERAYNYRKDPRMEGVAARVAEQRRAELLGEDFIRFMDVGELPSHLKHPAGYARDDVRGAFEKMREIALRAYKWTGGSRVDSSVEEYFEDILAGRKGRVFKDENLKNVVRWLDSRPGALPGRGRGDDEELAREMMTSVPGLMNIAAGKERVAARLLIERAIAEASKQESSFSAMSAAHNLLTKHSHRLGGYQNIVEVSREISNRVRRGGIGLPSAEVPPGEKRKDRTIGYLDFMLGKTQKLREPPEFETDIPRNYEDAFKKNWYQKVLDKLDVESAWKRIGAPETGFNIKNVFSQRTLHQEGGIDIIKRVAKTLNHNEVLMKTAILAREDRVYLDAFPEHRAKMEEAVGILDRYFDQSLDLYKAAGVLSKGFKERILDELEDQLKSETDPIKRDQLRRDVARVEKLEFAHIPTAMWFRSKFANEPAKARKVLDYLAIQKRENVSIADMVKEGVIELKDIKLQDVVSNYARRLGKDMSLLNVVRAARTEGLAKPLGLSEADAGRLSELKEKKKRTEKEKAERKGLIEKKKRLSVPDYENGFVGAPNIARVLKGFQVHGELSEWLRTMGDPNPRRWYERIFARFKMFQFWNPFFLPMYDTFQTFMLTGLGGMTQVARWTGGTADYIKKTPEYWEALDNGLMSKPFDNPFQTFKQMADNAAMKGGTRFVKALMDINPLHLLDRLYTTSWNMAWAGDGALRMNTYRWLRGVGYSEREAAQLAATAHADYAAVPPGTRRALNMMFFTPTFKIAMARFYKRMTEGGLKMGAWATQTDAGMPVRPERRYALAAAYTAAGIVAFNELMEYMGFETEDFGVKWKRDIETDRGIEELTVHVSSPMNMFLKYAHRVKNSFAPDKDNPMLALLRSFKWEVHPIWRIFNEVAWNRADDSFPIYDRNVFYSTNTKAKVREAGKIFSFIGKELFAMFDLMEFTPRTYGQRRMAEARVALGREASKDIENAVLREAVDAVVQGTSRLMTFTYLKGRKDEKALRKIKAMGNELVRDLERRDELGKDPAADPLTLMEGLKERIKRIVERDIEP
jgi:hypothetical protein